MNEGLSVGSNGDDELEKSCGCRCFRFFSPLNSFLKHDVVIETQAATHFAATSRKAHTTDIVRVISTWFNQSTILDCWHRKELASGDSQVEEYRPDEMDDNYCEEDFESFFHTFKRFNFLGFFVNVGPLNRMTQSHKFYHLNYFIELHCCFDWRLWAKSMRRLCESKVKVSSNW